METSKQIRDLCALVALASGDAEFEADLANLKRALREHTLRMENLQTQATLEIASRTRSLSGA
jgi:hypothetical protein